jgi:hypothetical protein
MGRALRIARFPLVLTVVLALVLLVKPGRADIALHGYLLGLAAIGLGLLLAALRGALPPRRPSAFDAALRTRARRTQRIPELERMEREVALGLAIAIDLHQSLRPRLGRIAAGLLASRRGIDLEANPDAARRALGDDAWEIVRGGREPPSERFATGLDLASLRLAVSALEKL